MFKSVITATPLTTDAANSYFGERISGAAWNRDLSFLASLRALLDSRIQGNNTLYLSFSNSVYNESHLADTGTERAIYAVTNGFPVFNNTTDGHAFCHIHNFSNPSQTANVAWMELMKSSFAAQRSGWHCIEKVTLFFRKTFYVLCFINPERKSTIIFTEGLNICRLHYLQAGMPSFMPWYFTNENGEMEITEQEMELLQALREKTSQHYEDCIASFAERYDFKSARVRQLLAGFETRYERLQCDTLRANLENIMASINDLNARIGHALRQQRDCENQLLGLEMKIGESEGDSEIMEYFLCNDHLVLENVTNSTMVFVARDYLMYFDEELARKVINNEASYVYRPNGRACNNYIKAEDIKMLMTALFLDQTLKMKFCAAYEFELEGNVHGISGYSYGSDFREYMPNTHIDRYHCLGSYSRNINDCLSRRDYIGALEQSIASCKSLNFADSAVMCEFMRRIYGISDYSVNTRCIELPNGNIVTPKEAIAYLKKEAEANG